MKIDVCGSLTWLLLPLWLLVGNAQLGAQDLVAALQQAKTFVTMRQGDQDLIAVPALTTNNPTRGAGLDGTMLLWVSHGRPLAAMSIYAWEGKIMHESDSLARAEHNDLVALSKTGQRWAPKQPGVIFKPLATEPDNAQLNDAQRLLKMKNFAKQFEVTMLGFNDQNSDREQLRLLATPVYRYQLKDDRTAHRELIDGSVFAFVQGTDPETLLMIELNRRDKSLVWEYALVRATAGGLEAKWNDKIVFEAAKFPTNTNATLPHFTFSHEVSELMKAK